MGLKGTMKWMEEFKKDAEELGYTIKLMNSPRESAYELAPNYSIRKADNDKRWWNEEVFGSEEKTGHTIQFGNDACMHISPPPKQQKRGKETEYKRSTLSSKTNSSFDLD